MATPLPTALLLLHDVTADVIYDQFVEINIYFDTGFSWQSNLM
jgi:hypothetical protein